MLTLHYWLSVAHHAWQNQLVFLGKSKGGILLDILVVVGTVGLLWHKNGWAAMKTKVKEVVLEGLAITLLAALLVYLYQFFISPAEMQADSDQKTLTALKQEGDESRLLNVCGSKLQVQQDKVGLLIDQRDRQQETVTSEQNQLNGQQSTINQCVVSLSKMNPKVHERISVINVALAVTDVNGILITGKEGVVKRYYTVLFVLTNEVEPVFHGTLRCANPFGFSESPRMVASTQTVITTNAPPTKINDREYEISAGSSGTEWAPARPVYMTVVTDQSEPGLCTFTPLN